MPIVDSDSNIDNAIFYTESYKTLIRSEKEILVSKCQLMPITDRATLYAHRFDFNRLLRFYQVPAHLRWTVAFLNGITDPFQDVSGMTSFLTISEGDITKLISRSNTTHA